jgi:hypothetical protein
VALERRFERGVYALILALLLITLLVPNIGADVVTLIAGAILMGSAIYQTSRRWRVNPLTWAGGIVLLFMGYVRWQTPEAIPGGIAFPLLIIIGVVVGGVLTGDL